MNEENKDIANMNDDTEQNESNENIEDTANDIYTNETNIIKGKKSITRPKKIFYTIKIK